MKIDQKLIVSDRPDCVSFIQEGVFYGLYNQSAYIVTVLLGLPLTITVKTVKKLNYCQIIRAGLPKSSIIKNFSSAQSRLWGYELHGQFDLLGYDAWRDEFVAKATIEADHAALNLNEF